MKKILSIATIALFSLTVLFTSCRNDASTQTQTEETTQPATEAPAAEQPAETQEATNAVDTTQQQAQ